MSATLVEHDSPIFVDMSLYGKAKAFSAPVSAQLRSLLSPGDIVSIQVEAPDVRLATVTGVNNETGCISLELVGDWT